MSTKRLFKLAEKFEKKLEEVDPDIVVREHEELDPVSYMAYSNLKNIITDSSELLSIINSKDDLPQWADEMLGISKNNVTKVLGYIRSKKVKTASAKCSDCNDVHCCMNYSESHSDMNSDTNEAKCIGTKHSPVGSPRQRAFCARHCGMRKKLTTKEVANDPESCINKGLRRWKCRCPK